MLPQVPAEAFRRHLYQEGKRKGRGREGKGSLYVTLVCGCRDFIWFTLRKSTRETRNGKPEQSMRPQMTAQQAEALTGFLVALRPGQRSWTKGAVSDALATAAATRTNDTELLARAAIRAALTASIKTPEVIPMPGAHWDGVGDYAAETPLPPKGRCRDCGGVHGNAPCDPKPDDRHSKRADHIAELRAEHAAAKQRLCPHGVPAFACADHKHTEAP